MEAIKLKADAEEKEATEKRKKEDERKAWRQQHQGMAKEIA